jgi:hypothetical protein
MLSFLIPCSFTLGMRDDGSVYPNVLHQINRTTNVSYKCLNRPGVLNICKFYSEMVSYKQHTGMNFGHLNVQTNSQIILFATVVLTHLAWLQTFFTMHRQVFT